MNQNTLDSKKQKTKEEQIEPMLSVIIVIAFLALLILIPFFLYKLAMASVIERFQAHRAIDQESAKSIESLGLPSPNKKNNLFTPKDYKADVIRALLNSEIVQITDDGRVYLLEEKYKRLKRGKR